MTHNRTPRSPILLSYHSRCCSDSTVPHSQVPNRYCMSPLSVGCLGTLLGCCWWGQHQCKYLLCLLQLTDAAPASLPACCIQLLSRFICHPHKLMCVYWLPLRIPRVVHLQSCCMCRPQLQLVCGSCVDASPQALLLHLQGVCMRQQLQGCCMPPASSATNAS